MLVDRIILEGRIVYEKVVKNPDYLAQIVNDLPYSSDLRNTVQEAFKNKTGADMALYIDEKTFEQKEGRCDENRLNDYSYSESRGYSTHPYRDTLAWIIPNLYEKFSTGVWAQWYKTTFQDIKREKARSKNRNDS